MGDEGGARVPRDDHKPVGPVCNLGCDYCFYLEKAHLYEGNTKWRMSDEVLESYVRQYIESQSVPEVSFAWQGGEPTLMGVKFFRRVVELQWKYAGGKRVVNAFQTNGTLLDDEWGEFLAGNHFLVGLSIDGPREMHDRYRRGKRGEGTFDDVMRGLGVLKRHRVEFNTMTVVNRENAQRPLEAYRFLKEIGSGFMQFIPVVEREAGVEMKVRGQNLAGPPVAGADAGEGGARVTAWSVEPRQYGEFLCRIFDEWGRYDVGRVFVQMFDVALGQWAGAGAGLCVFAETCGGAMAMEHNGDLYACDHYVYPRYRLGNLMERPLGELVDAPQQRRFGMEKLTTLPEYCRRCEWRFACNGECPKHRFMRTPDGEEGLNYLCPAYKRFFRHVDPYMKTMTQLLRERKPPAMIMGMLQDREGRSVAAPSVAMRGMAGRNESCPCGSGRKYKNCCGMPGQGGN